MWFAFIESVLKEGECGKALRLLRENRGLLPAKEYFENCELAWARISRLDERFRSIWLEYLSKLGISNCVFPIDRPASRHQVDSIQEQVDLGRTNSVNTQLPWKRIVG